jgi:hypothetical protein
MNWHPWKRSAQDLADRVAAMLTKLIRSAQDEQR